MPLLDVTMIDLSSQSREVVLLRPRQHGTDVAILQMMKQGATPTRIKVVEGFIKQNHRRRPGARHDNRGVVKYHVDKHGFLLPGARQGGGTRRLSILKLKIGTMCAARCRPACCVIIAGCLEASTQIILDLESGARRQGCRLIT